MSDFLILPSGAFCLVRSKHVCASRDEPHPEHGFCAIPAGLDPGDHHWLTLVCEYWDSHADFEAGAPSVLKTDPQFGHRFVLAHAAGALMPKLSAVIDSHHVGGRRGEILDPTRHPSHAVEDVLGLLKHPDVAALVELTP